MKTIILSLLIFILLFLGIGYFVKDLKIPMLSQIGKDVHGLLSPGNYNEFLEETSIVEGTENLVANIVTGTANESLSVQKVLDTPSFTRKSSDTLKEMFSFALPSDADCGYSLNEDYVVCTSLSELEDYIIPLPIDERQTLYKRESGIKYFPLPTEIIEKTLPRYQDKGDTGRLKMGEYIELKYAIAEDSGLFDVNFETKKDLSSYTISNEVIEEEYREAQEYVSLINDLFDFDTTIFEQEYNSLSDIPITEEIYESLKNIEAAFAEPSFAENYFEYKLPEGMEEKVAYIGSEIEFFISLYEEQNGASPLTSSNTVPYCGSTRFSMYGDDYINSIDSCSSYQCQHSHISESDYMVKRSVSKEGDTCVLLDILPNDMTLECNLSKEQQTEMSDFYRRMQVDEDARTSFEGNVIMDYLDEGICAFST